ncbi:hypothetical protein MA16_Dca013879 [Dendrobium catenatum]|uniref:Uncharacterized protein n=1 Tax=Dendrobium catenatum TaxID=906689 RepID=A0A2I0WCQ2_9ASPA|nr:hypothetical protein MA16_Dca013879 [Dendrobium catenatum]
MLVVNSSDKAQPIQCSQVVQCNVTEGFDPKFVISGDEGNVTHGDREIISLHTHRGREVRTLQL